METELLGVGAGHQCWEWRPRQLTWIRYQGCGSGGMKVKVTGLQVATALQAQTSDFQNLGPRVTCGVWEKNVNSLTYIYFH